MAEICDKYTPVAVVGTTPNGSCLPTGRYVLFIPRDGNGGNDESGPQIPIPERASGKWNRYVICRCS